VSALMLYTLGAILMWDASEQNFDRDRIPQWFRYVLYMLWPLVVVLWVFERLPSGAVSLALYINRKRKK
jgi:hypothetical protein